MIPKKILYIATEVDPFLQLSSCATIVTELAQTMVGEKYEVRIMMPKFGIINERKNRIHEVQRLYGINVRIAEENISLVVKVASIRKGKVQVYFIDNEELFQKKRIFYDENDRFYPDNDVRIAFMCKAIWSILKNLNWGPHIIHCFGWPWVFVHLYGKRVYNKMPLFKNTKFIQTYCSDYFKGNFKPSMLEKVHMAKIQDEDLAPLSSALNYPNFLSLGKKYADKTTYTFSETHTRALESLTKLNTPCVANDDNLLSNYLDMYAKLLQPNKTK